MSNTMYVFVVAVLVGSVTLGLFAPAPRVHIDNDVLKVLLASCAVGVVLAFVLWLAGKLDAAVLLGAASESVFMLMVWLVAGQRPRRRRYDDEGGWWPGGGDDGPPRTPSPWDWGDFDRARVDWSRPKAPSER